MFNDMPWLYGPIITSVVGVVIIRISHRTVAERIVPAMCGITCWLAHILVTHAGEIPAPSVRLSTVPSTRMLLRVASSVSW